MFSLQAEKTVLPINPKHGAIYVSQNCHPDQIMSGVFNQSLKKKQTTQYIFFSG